MNKNSFSFESEDKELPFDIIVDILNHIKDILLFQQLLHL